DLLLLDEPTNHLDLEAALWLGEFLGRYRQTLILVSHDRQFIDDVADHVMHLSEPRLHLYNGGAETLPRPPPEALARHQETPPPPGGVGGPASARRQAGGRAQASPILRRPLSRQGEQGEPSAKPVEASRQARAGGARRKRAARRVSFPRSRSARAAAPHLRPSL